MKYSFVQGREDTTRHVINSEKISQSRAPEGRPVSVQLGPASPIITATNPEIAKALAAGSLFPSFNHPPLPKCDLGLHQLTFLSLSVSGLSFSLPFFLACSRQLLFLALPKPRFSLSILSRLPLNTFLTILSYSIIQHPHSTVGSRLFPHTTSTRQLSPTPCCHPLL